MYVIGINILDLDAQPGPTDAPSLDPKAKPMAGKGGKGAEAPAPSMPKKVRLAAPKVWKAVRTK